MAGLMQRHADDGGQLRASSRKMAPLEGGLHHTPGAFGLQAFADAAAALQVGELVAMPAATAARMPETPIFSPTI